MTMTSPTTDHVAILRRGSAAKPDFFFSGGLSAQRSTRLSSRFSGRGSARFSGRFSARFSRRFSGCGARGGAGRRTSSCRTIEDGGRVGGSDFTSKSFRSNSGGEGPIGSPGASRKGGGGGGSRRRADGRGDSWSRERRARALRGRGPVRRRAARANRRSASRGVGRRAGRGGSASMRGSAGTDSAAAGGAAPSPRRKRHDRCRLARWPPRSSVSPSTTSRKPFRPRSESDAPVPGDQRGRSGRAGNVARRLDADIPVFFLGPNRLGSRPRRPRATPLSGAEPAASPPLRPTAAGGAAACPGAPHVPARGTGRGGGSVRERRAASVSTLRIASSSAKRSRVMSDSLSAGVTPRNCATSAERARSYKARRASPVLLSSPATALAMSG